MLFQAGASGRGQRFAARHAECVIISAPDEATARRRARSLREEVGAAGRRAEDVKVLMGIRIVAGDTDAQARDRLADHLVHASPEAGLAHVAAGTGGDFSRYGLDEAIAYGTSSGLSKRAYREGTLRAKLLGRGNRLDEAHVGGSAGQCRRTPA